MLAPGRNRSPTRQTLLAATTAMAIVSSGWARRAPSFMPRRALLVSHWPVNSDAAVKLTTGAFEVLKSDPSIGRSEALHRSMVELITLAGPQDREPGRGALKSRF